MLSLSRQFFGLEPTADCCKLRGIP